MSILTGRLPHVFRWPVAHPIRLLLPGMILVSLLLHALAAYIFTAATPPPSPLWPPMSKLLILPSESLSEMSLLTARDPSWMEPGRFRAQLLPAVRPQRSVLALQPTLPPLLAAPPEKSDARWVPSLPPLAVRPWFETPAPPPAPPSFVPTLARFESGWAGVTPDVLDRLRAVAPGHPPGRGTELLVVLAPTGDVRHTWVLRGSGDATLDLAAQRAVQRARFASSPEGVRDALHIVWGEQEGEQ